jgi:hypothetical protein
MAKSRFRAALGALAAFAGAVLTAASARAYKEARGEKLGASPYAD